MLHEHSKVSVLCGCCGVWRPQAAKFDKGIIPVPLRRLRPLRDDHHSVVPGRSSVEEFRHGAAGNGVEFPAKERERQEVLLDRPRRPLSRGFDPASYPTQPLVSYQTNRQLSGWNLPPLMMRAIGAH
jgi:hypothetical protein